MAKYSDKPERPRAEPEILPPDRSGARGPSWPPHRFSPDGFAQTRGTHRIYVNKIGPFGFALLMLVVGLLGGVLLLALIASALIWIPVVAVLFVVATILGMFRRR